LWLKARDKNTTYIYKKAKAWAIRNNVQEIIIDDGTRILDFKELKNVAKTHYASFLTQQGDVAPKALATMFENILVVV